MRIFYLIPLLFITFQTFAQKAHITIIDPNIEPKGLAKHFHVHRGSTHLSSVPSKSSRDDLLKDVKGIDQWDEVKKDIFFMDLKNKKIDDLRKKYPEISMAQLETLKAKRKK